MLLLFCIISVRLEFHKLTRLIIPVYFCAVLFRLTHWEETTAALVSSLHLSSWPLKASFVANPFHLPSPAALRAPEQRPSAQLLFCSPVPRIGTCPAGGFGMQNARLTPGVSHFSWN